MRRLVICNPRARRIRGRPAVDWVAARLREAGLETEVVAPEDRAGTEQAAREAAAQGYDQVVAAGGDGTINAVASGLAYSDVPLGVLPLGTGNVLAHNLGVATLPAALAALRGGRRLQVDLGWISDRYFVALAGVGFDALVVQRVAADWQHVLGRHAFVLEGLIGRCLNEPHQFRLVSEGQEPFRYEGPAWSALVCNCPGFTWDLPLARRAEMSDGELDLILFRHVAAWQFFARLGERLLTVAQVGDLPGVTCHRLTNLEVEVRPDWGWEVDGEWGGATPARLEVRPQALAVVAAAN